METRVRLSREEDQAVALQGEKEVLLRGTTMQAIPPALRLLLLRKTVWLDRCQMQVTFGRTRREARMRGLLSGWRMEGLAPIKPKLPQCACWKRARCKRHNKTLLPRPQRLLKHLQSQGPLGWTPACKGTRCRPKLRAQARLQLRRWHVSNISSSSNCNSNRSSVKCTNNPRTALNSSSFYNSSRASLLRAVVPAERPHEVVEVRL
mmetsp:Transcript_4710/g.10063  ORF Transcript_4710/g.10063 Transcript_4710/m.10063 type:complete len:206 (+) Transcript_4710:295-912(+)